MATSLSNEELETALVAWETDPVDAAATYGDINTWDTSAVTDMSGSAWNDAFFDSSFNADISGWDVGSVTTMEYTFTMADAFNQDIGAWDTSSVVTMDQMFVYANAFDQDLTGWDVCAVSSYEDFANGSALSADNEPEFDVVICAGSTQGPTVIAFACILAAMSMYL